MTTLIDPVIGQGDLEVAFGVPAVAQLASNGQSGADPDTIAWALGVATDDALGILRISGYDLAKLVLWVAEDRSVKHAVASIAMAILGERKIELSGAAEAGGAPYRSQGKDGRAKLAAKAKAEERSPAAEEDPAIGATPRTKTSSGPRGKRYFGREGGGGF